MVSFNEDYVTIHGVTFRKNDFDKCMFTSNGEIAVFRDGIIKYNDGYIANCVVLKDGTNILFKDQQPSNDACVGFDKNGRLCIYGLDDAIVKDTENNDNYYFMKCSNVNIFSNEAKKNVQTNIPSITGGGNYNTETWTNKDKMEFRDCTNTYVFKEGAKIVNNTQDQRISHLDYES